MSIGSTLVRNLARASAVAALAALCVAPVPAAESSKPPAKKPAAPSKATTTKPSATKTKPATKQAAATCAPVSVPVDCTLPANFVEPVCKPAATQVAGQKFNTFEDIYAPPSAPEVTGAPQEAPKDAPAPPPKMAD